MTEIFIIFTVFITAVGACIGSFLNVVALRALSGESIIFPPSKCPVCSEPVKWYDNIPVISYIFLLGGKCRNCRCKISIQYPIVEALTAVLFWAVFVYFGISWQSLFLIILLCLSLVIIITDLRKGYVFDKHSLPLIVFAIIYSISVRGLSNFATPVIGLLVATVLMETLAKVSYFLIKPKNVTDEQNNETLVQSENVCDPRCNCQTQNEQTSQTQACKIENDEEVDINEYIKKNKRAFGEGDTLLAAAAGAVLGWKYFIVALFCSILLQTACIFPQFIKDLCEKNEKRLLVSLFAFFIIAIVYFVLSNAFSLNVFVILAMVVALIFFAFDSLIRLKKIKTSGMYKAVPFGPALLITMFLILFFGKYVSAFIIKHIFFMSMQ